MKFRTLAAALAATVVLPVSMAHAVDLEVTHWWTSGGEAAAVAEFAKAFDATGNHWVDGAIAGSGDTARPIMVSRITGGDPMGATQFNHGRQAEELVEAGLMRDLDDVATGRELGRRGQPAVAARRLHARRPRLLRAGQHPRLAVALALQRGLRRRRRAGPDQLDRVRRRRPGAGKGRHPAARRRRAGLAAGRRSSTNLVLALGGKDMYLKVYKDKDADARRRRRHGARSGRPPTTPARWPRARTSRTGTRPPTW